MTPETTREKVVHNYTDRSTQPDPTPEAGKEGQGMAGMDHNFPMKLHYMLSNCDGQEHIVSWQPHGRCFMVHDMKEFVASMLPLWFRQSKFASFQRQLNLYGFQRLTQGRDKNAYYHEYFLRGRPLLAHTITRTKVKGKGARKASSPETEPQLYDLPWMEAASSGAAQPGEPQMGAPACATSMSGPLNPNQRISPTLATLAHLAPNPGSPPVARSAFSVPAVHPHRSLGEALGFLSTLGQVQAAMPSPHVTVFPGGETMYLPSTSTNPNALNTLLSSFNTRCDPTPNSAVSRYVPIAPAPPTQESQPIKPSLDTGSNYATVLEALKVQHGMAEAALAPANPFTTPGPPLF